LADIAVMLDCESCTTLGATSIDYSSASTCLHAH
jgi:hypothetical protein